MRKKLVSLVAFTFILCMVLTNAGRANASTPTFTVYPTSIEVPEVGQAFQVNITVTDAPPITQWALNITWNPNVLNITDPDTDIIEGDIFSGHETMFLVKPPQPGRIPEMTCLIMELTTVSGNGTLCTITFNATAVGESNINIDWGVLILEDGVTEIEPTLIDGSVTVIPEFPLHMLLPIFLAITATIVIITRTVWRRKHQGYTTVNKTNLPI